MSSSRTQEEVAELEKALCFLIKRSADIQDAKDAKSVAEDDKTTADILNPSDPPKPTQAAAGSSQLPSAIVEHALPALADAFNPGSSLAGTTAAGVTADSELITPEVEKLLPVAAHRVSY